MKGQRFLQSNAPGARRLSSQRVLDFLLASIALLLLAPLMVVITIGILLESRGPTFFCQTRIGQGGKRFCMYKFRKFRADAGQAGSPLTLDQDPRMTEVGRLLMKTKFDELPQLWNVIRGDMAIVGPRPESLAFADCFEDGWEELLEYKPGLLGPCQIIFRNEAATFPSGADVNEFYRTVLFPLKARIDLDYFRSRSIPSDIGIMFKGFLAICGWNSFAKPNHKHVQHRA
jgi:lipopolysaccharide/colanic/teichoic acid biosynthesis glycosyltransferase